MQRERPLPKDMTGMQTQNEETGLAQDQILLKDIQTILTRLCIYTASDSIIALIYCGLLPSSPPHLELFALLRTRFSLIYPPSPQEPHQYLNPIK